MVLSSIVFSLGVFANEGLEAIRKADEQRYSPVVRGLQRLTFEARVEGLKERVEQELIMLELSDLYFVVKWNKSNTQVEVHGLPSGFHQVKSTLAAVVQEKMEFIIPSTMLSKLDGYTTKQIQRDGVQVIVAEDESMMKAVKKMEISLGKNGALSKLSLSAPGFEVASTYTLKKNSATGEKMLLERVETDRIYSGIREKSIEAIEYGSIDGFVLPFSITTKRQIDGSEFQEQKISFSNHRVNEKSLE